MIDYLGSVGGCDYLGAEELSSDRDKTCVF